VLDWRIRDRQQWVSGHSGWCKNSGVGKAGGDKENLIGIMMSQVPLANGSPYRREMRYLTYQALVDTRPSDRRHRSREIPVDS